MLPFLSRTKSRLQPGIYRKRHFRTAVGYTLLAISIITSFTTLAVSLGRHQITAFQVSTPVSSGSHILRSQLSQIEITSSNKKISSQFATGSDIASMITRHPLTPGDLVERADLESAVQHSGQPDEMSVPLDASKAPISEIAPGDYVELIATIGSGSAATSRVVASAAKVIGITKTSSSFGQTGQSGADLLLSVNNPLEAIAIAQAETAGSLVGIKDGGDATPAFQGVFSLENRLGQGNAASTSQPPLNGQAPQR